MWIFYGFSEKSWDVISYCNIPFKTKHWILPVTQKLLFSCDWFTIDHKVTSLDIRTKHQAKSTTVWSTAWDFNVALPFKVSLLLCCHGLTDRSDGGVSPCQHEACPPSGLPHHASLRGMLTHGLWFLIVFIYFFSFAHSLSD